MNLRNETTHDTDTIRAITIDAFGETGEADLVDKLRIDGDLTISVVAEVEKVLCGHVAFSRLKAPANALALAPVSVITAMQARGIGTELVRHGLNEARIQGFDLVFVLGAPEYYQRFGFLPDLATGFKSEYSGSSFMALWLDSHKPTSSTTLLYPDAFTGLD